MLHCMLQTGINIWQARPNLYAMHGASKVSMSLIKHYSQTSSNLHQRDAIFCNTACKFIFRSLSLSWHLHTVQTYY